MILVKKYMNLNMRYHNVAIDSIPYVKYSIYDVAKEIEIMFTFSLFPTQWMH